MMQKCDKEKARLVKKNIFKDGFPNGTIGKDSRSHKLG